MIKLTNNSFLKSVIGLFLGLGILFIPFPYEAFYFHYTFIQNTIGKLLYKAVNATHYFEYVIPEIQSDSILMYALFITLLFSSLCIGFTFKKQIPKILQSKYFDWLLTFYLSLHLVKYGFSKIFLKQFYTPEPNILATPMGNLDTDILYWSVIGTTPNYQLFLGLIEILSGLLLLSKRTQKVGLYLTLSVLINIVAVNLTFDISVKLFSAFLTLLCLYLLYPIFKKDISNIFKDRINLTPKSLFFGFFLVLLLFFECVYPSFSVKDQKKPFEGVYVIQNSNSIKKLFFHKDDYLIFQLQNDSLIDFKYSVNEKEKKITLTDYSFSTETFHYKTIQNNLYLNNENKTIKCIKIKPNYNALKNSFHWTVESVK
ncbi:hypothetical protein [Flavobacterium sp. GCM10023249]|uniref:hypothetical protein n=1 Tax=unclassified Flavobacterium TaxID=196869 RepID=UPI0036D23A0C